MGRRPPRASAARSRARRRRLPRGDGHALLRDDPGGAVQRDPAGRLGRQRRLQLLADGEPARRGHLLQRGRRLHPGRHLVVQRDVHLHDVDLEPDPELHGEPGVGVHHDRTQRRHLADRPRRRDHRDLQRHGHGPERRRLPRGDGDALLRDDPGGALQRDPAERQRRQRRLQLLTDIVPLAVGTYSSVDAVFSPGGTSSSNPDFAYTTSTSTPTQSFTVDGFLRTHDHVPQRRDLAGHLRRARPPRPSRARSRARAATATPRGRSRSTTGPLQCRCAARPCRRRSGDSADFSCSLTASQLDVGTYSSVDAVFTPGTPRRRTRTTRTPPRPRPRPRASWSTRRRSPPPPPSTP